MTLLITQQQSNLGAAVDNSIDVFFFIFTVQIEMMAGVYYFTTFDTVIANYYKGAMKSSKLVVTALK
jgi:hypothetical protein